jgi:hypothetical protein
MIHDCSGWTTHRAGNLDAPLRIKRLPRDDQGRPVPWFAIEAGVADYRSVTSERWHRAVRGHKCWTCGEALGGFLAFVSGPLLPLTRVTVSPPSHRECAEYAATQCPHLRDRQSRTFSGAPNGDPVRAPNVACVWVTRGYRVLNAGGQALLQVATATDVMWFTAGRASSREEVEAAIAAGLPELRHAARLEDVQRKDGRTTSQTNLDRRLQALASTLPAA